MVNFYYYYIHTHTHTYLFIYLFINIKNSDKSKMVHWYWPVSEIYRTVSQTGITSGMVFTPLTTTSLI